MNAEIVEKLRNLNLPEDSLVNLSFEDHSEVFHYTEDYHDEVLSDTGIIESIASLVSTFKDNVTSYGDSILENMRQNNLLDNYERDGTFDDYLSEVLYESHWDLDIVEWSTEKYDHKRGCCTVSATFAVPLSCLYANPEAQLTGWEASVKTPLGTLILN